MSDAVVGESAPASRQCSPDPQGAPLEAGTGASDQYLEGTPKTSPSPRLLRRRWLRQALNRRAQVYDLLPLLLRSRPSWYPRSRRRYGQFKEPLHVPKDSCFRPNAPPPGYSPPFLPLSRSLMGLILLMARRASIDAVRRCLELCRRGGVPTIYPWGRPGNENPLQNILDLQQWFVYFGLTPMLLITAHKCYQTAPPNRQQLAGHSTTSTKCAIQP